MKNHKHGPSDVRLYVILFDELHLYKRKKSITVARMR